MYNASKEKKGGAREVVQRLTVCTFLAKNLTCFPCREPDLNYLSTHIRRLATAFLVTPAPRNALVWSPLDTCPHGHTLLRRHTAKHEIKNNEKNPKGLKKSNGELQFTHQGLAKEIQRVRQRLRLL